MPGAVEVPLASLRGVIEDKVGVCIGCGAMTDPVPLDDVCVKCEDCGMELVCGLIPALEFGAIQVIA